ncbi:sulfotransferase family protein [Mesorhizobium sophorae]|uniref:sulfotransferase family protein n=1 Tax=Mesorhizobium sophorae TaxID=1300294 RepID=UPI00117E3615|nr:sulfotransferase [Mesorhizobium sophorae]
MPALKTPTSGRANLIGIGAPRTATSSLARMLGATRDVFVPEEKEINGFGIDDDVTEARYDTHFAEAAVDHRYLADISPVYLSSAQVAERIRSYNPQAKIIATLREPVSRVISQYRHMKGKIDASLGPELSLDINSYIRNGLIGFASHRAQDNSWYSASMNIEHSFYGRHLRRYYQSFPRNQILVLIYEDLIRPHPVREKGAWEQQLQQFLGVRVSQKYWDNRAEGFETEIAGDVAGDLKKLFATEVSMASDLTGRDLVGLWGY